MKKLLYILALSFILGTSIISCTEENIEPTTNEAGGGGVSDPK